ncbi:hypothetical protein OROMI_003579 [Orobanche minor]
MTDRFLLLTFLDCLTSRQGHIISESSALIVLQGRAGKSSHIVTDFEFHPPGEVKNFVALISNLGLHKTQLFVKISNSLRDRDIPRLCVEKCVNACLLPWPRTILGLHQIFELVPGCNMVLRPNSLPPISGLSSKEVLGNRDLTILGTVGGYKNFGYLLDPPLPTNRVGSPRKLRRMHLDDILKPTICSSSNSRDPSRVLNHLGYGSHLVHHLLHYSRNTKVGVITSCAS